MREGFTTISDMYLSELFLTKILGDYKRPLSFIHTITHINIYILTHIYTITHMHTPNLSQWEDPSVELLQCGEAVGIPWLSSQRVDRAFQGTLVCSLHRAAPPSHFTGQ